MKKNYIYRNIANFLTLSRIIVAILLIFIKVQSTGFFIIYLLCGITDVLDGIFARKSNTVKSSGALLDSLADFIFVLVVFLKYIFIINFNIGVWLIIAFIALIKILSSIICFIKFKKFLFFHTYLNKFTGLILFLFPVMKIFMSWNKVALIICPIAILTTIEELIITIICKKYNPNIKTFLELNNII